MQPPNAPGSLIQVLEREDLTLDELTQFAEVFLTTVAPRQTRYKVTERPDARTVRYYVSQGLLPRAIGRQGGRARYAGTHLLRLLFIKRQQTRHHSLRRIGEALKGVSDAQILKLLLGDELPVLQDEISDARILEAEPPADVEWVREYKLGNGVQLYAGTYVLQSPDGRRQLAGALEALARRLRDESADVDD